MQERECYNLGLISLSSIPAYRAQNGRRATSLFSPQSDGVCFSDDAVSSRAVHLEVISKEVRISSQPGGNKRCLPGTHFAIAVGVARFRSRSRGRCGLLRCVIVVVVMRRSSCRCSGAAGGTPSRSRVRIVTVSILVGRVFEHARLAGPDDIVCVGIKGATDERSSVNAPPASIGRAQRMAQLTRRGTCSGWQPSSGRCGPQARELRRANRRRDEYGHM